MHRTPTPLFRKSIASALALALAVSAAPAAAAAYIKFGDIKGEVQAWSWGETQTTRGGNVEFEWKVEEGESAAPRPGGTEDINIGVGELQQSAGTPTGKRQHKPMAVTKPVDKATPKLAEAVAKGKVFNSEPRPDQQGMLAVKVPAGTCVVGARYPNAEFGTGGRVYRLADVVVSGCSPSSGGDARPMESMSLNYAKVAW
ncbi:MAG TPA: type VI secretion system tube protein Hcp [Sphingomicrobium sp.]|nr:type VI secretion system tube protein Hcp [Sphingomicrobium sp.]